MPFPRRSALCAGSALGLTLLLAPAPSRAQSWMLDASAGRATHEPVLSAIHTTGATLSLRHEGARWLYLSGGFPFDTAGVSWGAAGLGTRLNAGSGAFVPGLDVGAHAFGYRDRGIGRGGGGATVEAMPLLSLGSGPLRLDVRSGLLHHTSIDTSQSTGRSLHASDARLVLGSAQLQISAEGRYWGAEEGNYPYAGASANLSGARGGAWAYAGRWVSDLVDGPVWGAGARLSLLSRTEIYAALQQETNDPLYGNTPRRSWSIGVSRRIGDATGQGLSPLAAERTDGKVTFRLPASVSATPPSVGGDFNAWNPVPMSRRGGFWVLSLPLGPGVHHYAFCRSNGEWFVPEAIPGRKDDGFGGVSATLVIP